MPTLEDLQLEIQKLKERNERVELNKTWETSYTRRVAIVVLTYVLVTLFFLITGVQHFWLNALVPTLGFILSTLSISLVKKVWIKKIYKK